MKAITAPMTMLIYDIELSSCYQIHGFVSTAPEKVRQSLPH
jgi:hypothetical protein